MHSQSPFLHRKTLYNKGVLRNELVNTRLQIKGECTMWVVTVFEQNNVRIFEYSDKQEATAAIEKLHCDSVLLSYTN